MSTARVIVGLVVFLVVLWTRQELKQIACILTQRLFSKSKFSASIGIAWKFSWSDLIWCDIGIWRQHRNRCWSSVCWHAQARTWLCQWLLHDCRAESDVAELRTDRRTLHSDNTSPSKLNRKNAPGLTNILLSSTYREKERNVTFVCPSCKTLFIV